MKSLKIANLNLKSPLILAPMLDVTDLPFRLLCRKAGASLAYTEMFHIEQILHKNPKTQNKLETNNQDKPVGLQLTGNTDLQFKSISKLPIIKKYELIDINCGCPSTRIRGNQAGSYLLTSPDKIASFIKILKQNTSKPVTTKIRLGFKTNNAIKISKIIEKAGADAITVHARLAAQSYKYPAQWQELKKIKKQIGIPIIANGDIFTGSDCAKVLDFCAGAMIGRTAIGNPLAFKSMLYYLKTGKEKTFSDKEKINQFKDYIKIIKETKTINMSNIKYTSPYFFKGFEGASNFREKLSKLKTFNEFEEFAKSL